MIQTGGLDVFRGRLKREIFVFVCGLKARSLAVIITYTKKKKDIK